ncbi:MAG TPA: IS110 family transposase [Mycobacterium sp.]
MGVDSAKRSHVLVAIDDSGRKLGEKTSKTTTSGHIEAMRWARKSFGSDEVVWAIEDCRHVSRLLQQDLLAAGHTVIRVPTRLMARTRASARDPGKSDPIDALAVARAALREPGLPTATFNEGARELKLLVDRREDLLGQRTATINRLLWRLHELDPEVVMGPSALSYGVHQDSARELLSGHHGLVADLARAELDDISRLTQDARALEKRINRTVRVAAPALLALQGCGPLSAAKIIAETAGVDRFRNEGAFARFCGVAPEPAWSGYNIGRMRFVKHGNRQVNTALHRIAITQIRDGAGRDYYRKRIECGDPPMGALRRLKRQLARIVYYRMKADNDAAVPA